MTDIAAIEARDAGSKTRVKTQAMRDRHALLDALRAAEAREKALREIVQTVRATPITSDDDGSCWFCLAPLSQVEHSDDCPYSEAAAALAEPTEAEG